MVVRAAYDEFLPGRAHLTGQRSHGRTRRDDNDALRVSAWRIE